MEDRILILKQYMVVAGGSYKRKVESETMDLRISITQMLKRSNESRMFWRLPGPP